MTEKLNKLMNDSAAARWGALILIASMMFFAYMFVDVMSPLKSMLEGEIGWSSTVFGTYAASEYILNVCGFLILAGIILDKMGVRHTGVLSASLMVAGACIKFVGISPWFQTTAFCGWLNSWWTALPGSAKMASLGFMIFGCGCEMAGTTVSKAIAKWFKGKEMSLAMGVEMAIARLGVFAVMWISPLIYNKFGTVVAPVAFCTALLFIGLIFFIVFTVMDRKFDSQLVAAGLMSSEKSPEDEFHVKDLGQIFSSKMFWIVALMCVLYYSAIFPFQKYAVNMLQCNLTLTPPAADSFWASESITYVQYIIMLLVAATGFASNFQKKAAAKYGLLAVSILSLITYCYMGFMRQSAESIFAVFPLLAVLITPILGSYVDHKGKAATMLVLGSLLLIACHLTFAFVLPAFKGNAVGGVIIAYLTILVLGSSFSLVPASLWPSVPKLVDAKVIGSAYALIFWIQNIGLWLFPLLIGKVLDSTNEGVTDPTQLNYTAPLVMLASLGVAALVLGLVLKVVDKKKGLGLEEPNIKE